MKTLILLFSAAIIQAAMPPLVDNQWVAVPNTKLIDVAPTNGEFPYTWGVEGPSAVFSNWAGAAFDYQRGRMFATGGGHCGYYGNEMYMYEVDSCKWFRLTNPTVPIPGYGCSGEQYEALIDTVSHDTTPQARHTYSGTCYIQHADRFLMVSRGYSRTMRDSLLKPDSITWMFDPFTKRWENRYPYSASGIIPKRSVGDLSVYDSVSRKVYYHGYSDGGASVPGWFAYDYDLNTWTRLNGDDGSWAAGCLDPKRRLVVEIGNNGKLTVWDIDQGFTGANWTTTRAGNALYDWCDYNCNRGIDYDRVNDRYVVWYETGDSVFVLDPETRVWDTYYATHNTGSTQGIYNRFRYVPTKGAFMAAANINNDVHFFKLVLPLHQDTSAMLSLDPHATSFTFEQYQTLPLVYTASFVDGVTDTVTWNCFFECLDTAVASVTQEGKVYGKLPGSARIHVRKITRMTTLDDTVTLTVVPTTAVIDSVRLDTALVHVLATRDTFRLAGTVYAHTGTGTISWRIDTAASWLSRNASVQVDEGVVAGTVAGGPVAVVVSQGGASDSCMVTVLPNPAFIKRINFQPWPSMPTPYGWLCQAYDWLYNPSRGYGWINYPDDGNTVSNVDNYLLQTRLIVYSGADYKVNVPDGEYIIKAGLGNTDPYYSGWNWMTRGTDTLVKWYDKTGEAGIGVDTVTVTGGNGLTVRFKGYVCYLIVISSEGIDINAIAEDGGLEPNTGPMAAETAIAAAAFGFTVNPSPFNPATRLSYCVPGGKGDARFSVFTPDGRLVREISVRSGRGQAVFDGRDLASGVYLIRLTAGGKVLEKKAVLIK